MAASYPTSAKTFTTKATNDVIAASHVNDLQDEVTAVESALLTALQHSLLFTDATYDIGASGATRPRDIFLSRDLTVGDQLIVSGVGPHAIGGGTTTADQIRLGGSFTSTSGVRGFSVVSSLSPAGTSDAYGILVAPTFVEGSSGTHNIFTSLYVQQPTITAGAASLANAATVYVENAPTGASNNYALWVDAGRVRIDDAVALGGGSAPTFGTIGGSGPATAAQNEWLRINTQNGARFIPVWA